MRALRPPRPGGSSVGVGAHLELHAEQGYSYNIVDAAEAIAGRA